MRLLKIKGHSTSKVIKRAVFKHPLTQWLICACVWLYIHLVYATSRVQWEIDPAAEPYMRGEENFILAFWHARMLVMPMSAPPGRKMHVMISGHHDGLIIARAMTFFGFGIVQGSSRKGGANAARGAIDALRKGDNVSITPDGPKGPAMKVQPGIVAIARLTGKPILPISYASRPCRRFHSWDRFVIALPFSRIRYHVGAPITVSSDKAAIGEVEAVMRAQTERLDALMGG